MIVELVSPMLAQLGELLVTIYAQVRADVHLQRRVRRAIRRLLSGLPTWCPTPRDPLPPRSTHADPIVRRGP